MSSAPSVAVIVASYNHADYLDQRMQSLLAQTHQSTEILVIDDCSTDNSRDVLDTFKNDPRVRLLYSGENRGWVATSNLGVELTSAEFIIFANCDDFCDPQLIASLLEALELNPSAAMSFCQSALVDQDNVLIGTDRTHRSRKFKQLINKDTLIDGGTATEFLIESCIIPNLSAALFRRGVLVEVGILSSSYRVVSDWDLFFKISKKYDIAYIHSALNSFRQHSTTIRSATKNLKIFEEYFSLLLGQIQPQPQDKRVNRLIRTSIVVKWISYFLIDPAGAAQNSLYFVRYFLKRDPKVFLSVPNAIFELVANRLSHES